MPLPLVNWRRKLADSSAASRVLILAWTSCCSASYSPALGVCPQKAKILSSRSSTCAGARNCWAHLVTSESQSPDLSGTKQCHTAHKLAWASCSMAAKT